MLKTIFILFPLLMLVLAARAGNGELLIQTVQGHVIDLESGKGLTGVIVMLESNNQLNAVTDTTGYFVLPGVPLGRQSFRFSITGYENKLVPEIAVTSGKQVEISVGMKENITQLGQVQVNGKRSGSRAQNEFASLSARGFNPEDTKRYAAAIADPARMASNFAGVSGSNDMSNGIVVRGNSPKGVLWRLEGIEIPNPNHFSSLGSTAGAISMLNANSLGASDFYTGAFPAEIGNATSGVFDLQLRKGNSSQPEHSVQIGTSGIEFSTEGGFSKDSKASYILSYRYSNPVLLKRFLPLKGVVPSYQDINFKLYFPTAKHGSFSVFGLAGMNWASKNPGTDSSKWNEENPNFRLKGKGITGIAGVSHQLYLNSNTYVKTILAGSLEQSTQTLDTLNPSESYKKIPMKQTDCSDASLKLSLMLNSKLDSRNTVRMGISGEQMSFRLAEDLFDHPARTWVALLNDKGNTQLFQGYVQGKNRTTDKLTLTGGVHFTWLSLNGKYSIEPRVSATYVADRQTFSLAAGLHSRPEHIAIYLLKKQKTETGISYPNKDLDMTRAFHAIAGYELSLPLKMRFKAEAYYQKLYNVAVEKDSMSGLSLLNTESMTDIVESKQLVSTGTGRNYGLDLSLERSFSDQYYFLLAGSVFRSTYTNYAGQSYSSRYDRGFQLNIVGGKEYSLGGQKHVLGLNAKMLYTGGQKESPIDLARSVQSGKTEYVYGQYYSRNTPAYFRGDASIYFKINNKAATHTIQLDVQNLTDHANYYYSYFDKGSGSIRKVNQLGILPMISYRIDFR